MSENKELNKEKIENVLKRGPGDIAFEPIVHEIDSPLAQRVIDKEDKVNPVKTSSTSSASAANSGTDKTATGEQSKTIPPQAEAKKEPMDAPEQEINAEPTPSASSTSTATSTATSTSTKEEPEFTIPIAQAGMMADTILGVVNNTVLEVGAGYFVTISKHKDFYDFDELVQVIDEQNVKNIKRMKLDEEDKAMLRPLLIHVLRKKAKVMTPEQQLLGVALSIIIKKSKIVLEIRAENQILVERIRDMIRREIKAAKDELQQEVASEEPIDEHSKEETKKDFAQEVYQETIHEPKVNKTGLPDSVLETN